MNTSIFLIDYFNDSPPIIQAAWIISGLFFILISGLILYLKYLRSYLRKKEKITAAYEQEYEYALITYLYAGNEEEAISLEQQAIIDLLKNYAKDPFKRKILIAVLVKLKNEISGEVAESIQYLYYQTELVDYALSRLSHKKWFVIAKGIRELKQFQIKEAYDQVIIHLNHPRPEVRKEMQLYMVNLFDFEGLTFLDLLETPLSEWDQIQLLEVLQKLENQNISCSTSWLQSSNDSVILFALKLAKIYNQLEGKNEIMQLLHHINKEVRLEAIDVLSYLNVLEAKEILKLDLQKRSEEEQIAFFKMMENLYESNDESFIMKYIHDDVFEIKVVALKILKIVNREKFSTLKSESSEGSFLKIVNFIEKN
ncbi:hypothetical protein [Flavobacterium sandaracinum]|uniref:HEAT repeat domain-containing protein n=1 Tax=Flavobacterium sandaracinum TaxID=2541733 RepID=A0A4R5D1I9_9FLAO|nr:hypothetical protein [Flavobacterium sandaracinum]TDE06966.1 hypothetical protein E0F91_03970 [Flavobacterium sandaracinum]